jgi:ParB family transcriptional regulator, chromosome partitioning protein
MNIDHIPLDRLSVSKANMRAGKKPPDIADILPSIIKRGVISPVFIRPNCNPGHFEIVAGKRRYYASLEAARQGKDDVTLPCITLGEGDDADALEISMIENMLRQAPDQVTQWESYTRLVKEGRSVEDIAATFALTELQVKRILALGNLLPRIREAFRAEEIDAPTVKHLTLATKAQQKAWLALFEDKDGYAPRGSQLKAWLFGGASISTSMALFDLADFDGPIVKDMFEEDGYFADADQFWAAQSAEIERRKAAYLEDGWSSVEIIPPGSHFNDWQYEKTPKRTGGRVYIQVKAKGEVNFHEGYLTDKEARRRDDETGGTIKQPAPTRPEITSAMTSYIDLHRPLPLNEISVSPIALQWLRLHRVRNFLIGLRVSRLSGHKYFLRVWHYVECHMSLTIEWMQNHSRIFVLCYFVRFQSRGLFHCFHGMMWIGPRPELYRSCSKLGICASCGVMAVLWHIS